MEEVDYSLVPAELIQELFPKNNEGKNESVMYIGKCSKFSRYNMKQERILIMSTQGVYLLTGGKKVSARHVFSELQCIIKSQQSKEFVLCFVNSKDLRLYLEDREDLLDIMKLRFANMNSDQSLKVYGVPFKELRDFKQNDATFSSEPEEKYLLKDESVLSEKEYTKEKSMTQKENTADDFNLSDNRCKPTANIEEHAGDASVQDMSADLSALFESTMSKVNANPGHIRRKVTNAEEGEFKGASLLKRKGTLIKKEEIEVKFEDFKMLMVLGRGAFGKVFLAELAFNKKLYAIKSIRKDILIEMDQVDNTILEKDIMFECDHPFLVGMDYLFQNELRLYFVMPFVRGGELYKVYQSQKRLNEDTVRFYAAQMTLALGYLHGKGIAHRDMKLENVLVDDRGYLKIIDYGLAKMLRDDQEATSFCGTPEYLAPEMVAQVGHDKTVDWWALGVLIYEMLIGVTPFFNRNKNMLLTKIKNSKVVFPDRKKYRIDYSDELMDLVLKLLDKDKSTRLGAQGDAEEILAHPFFASLNIKDLMEFKVEPPFKPKVEEGQDYTKYFNAEKGDAIGDTYIPRQNQKFVAANQDVFQSFGSKKGKK